MPPIKTLPPIHPNAGIESFYRRQLKRRIMYMSDAYSKWLLELMARKPTVDMLTLLLDGLQKKWLDDIGFSDQLAIQFAGKTQDYVSYVFNGQIKKAGGLGIDFSITDHQKEAYKLVVAQNVGLIKSIPQQYHDRVEAQVWEAMTTGGDLFTLKNNLRDSFGITERRAAFIARDQSSKATSTFLNARRLDAGLTEAIWLHSAGGKEPRPNHVKASNDKLRFDIRKGALIDGEYIQPGYLINCRCVSSTVIPALD